MRTGLAVGMVAIAAALGLAAVIGAVPGVLAQTPPQRGPASSALNYVPGVGDMMNTLVQPRHAKLGLAGREKNWALAAYLYKELQQAFSTVGTVQPKFRNLTVAEMIQSMTGDAMKDLGEAIDGKNAKLFAQAYGDLTDGCNSCHTALNHGFIVIKTPEASSFPNQEFKAQ
jgi:hypothetical protein